MGKKMNVRMLMRTGLLLAIALVFQIGFRSFAQPAVGPLVNLVLILSAGIVGTFSGVVVGCFTPLIAFALGIMPLFPVVPLIMVGNTLFVVLFNTIRCRVTKWGDVAGVIGAALVKFVWLALGVRYLIALFLPKVPPVLITTFSLPQLYTALIGGFLALGVIALLPKDLINK